MIVSTTSASVPLEVVVVPLGGGGGGATTSFVGILPARAVTDTTPVRTTANTTDFMLGLLFGLRMQVYLYQKW